MNVTQKNKLVKHCRICDCELVHGINWPNSRKKYRSYICNLCYNQMINGWKQVNRDRVMKVNLNWQKNHQDKVRLIKSNWAEKYPNKIRASIEKYDQTDKGKANRHKANYKHRKLGNIPMFSNPFDKSVPVRWHHIADAYTVAIPKDLHELLSGYKREKHRELVMNIVKQIYLESDFK